MLAPSNRRILAYLREFTGPDGQTEIIFCVANVSRSAQAAELEMSQYAGMVPVEMVGGSAFPPIGQLPYLLTLPPYGFYWFQLAPTNQMPSWHQEPVETMPDFQTLVLKRLDTLTAANRRTLEAESLPAYLPKRRWFAARMWQSTRSASATAYPSATRTGRCCSANSAWNRPGAATSTSCRWASSTSLISAPRCPSSWHWPEHAAARRWG